MRFGSHSVKKTSAVFDRQGCKHYRVNNFLHGLRHQKMSELQLEKSNSSCAPLMTQKNRHTPKNEFRVCLRKKISFFLNGFRGEADGDGWWLPGH
jgi:hypothetical protein